VGDASLNGHDAWDAPRRLSNQSDLWRELTRRSPEAPRSVRTSYTCWRPVQGPRCGLYSRPLSKFVDGGAGVGMLLRRAYQRAKWPQSTDREVLPYLGSLLSRWEKVSCRWTILATRQPRERCDHGQGAGYSCHDKPRFCQQADRARPQGFSRDGAIAIKRIFLKLGASTRTEAVCRAGSMGLL
jgi:hypothetical protein